MVFQSLFHHCMLHVLRANNLTLLPQSSPDQEKAYPKQTQRLQHGSEIIGLELAIMIIQDFSVISLNEEGDTVLTPEEKRLE